MCYPATFYQITETFTMQQHIVLLSKILFKLEKWKQNGKMDFSLTLNCNRKLK